jgi:PIN domain nuclease of toxin-antitoxin system
MTDYLLDTHALLWLSTDDERLTDPVRRIVLEGQHSLWVSAASVWEMAIKKSLGRLELVDPLEVFLEEQRVALGFRLVPIQARDAIEVGTLPWHHRDPFDRLLVAQARQRQFTVLSRDSNLALYEVDTCWG